MLGDCYTSGFDVCDSRAMQVVGNADNNTLRSSPTAHSSDARASELSKEDLTEVLVDPMDEDLQGEEVLVFIFDPQK